MQLTGSPHSPYIRHLRLWQAERPVAVNFISLDIYSPQGRKALAQFIPAMKVPVLQDGEQCIDDSRQIYRYLTQNTPADWSRENLLALLDAANDSFIILLLAKRSDLDIEQDSLLVVLQRERLAQTLPLFESAVQEGQCDVWDYPAICLNYLLNCLLNYLLDWILFRRLYDLTAYPALSAFHQRQQQRPGVCATVPRRV